MRFRSRQRLRRQGDFLKVREQGRTFRCPHFFLQLLETAPPEELLRRVGIITSRRIGNAVKRNRARRLFREIFRTNQEALPQACDTVIVVRSNCHTASLEELQELFLKGIQFVSNRSRPGGEF